MKNIIFAIAACACFGQSVAEEKLPPIEGFREMTVYQLMMCRIETKTALLKVEAGITNNPWEKIGACLKTGRVEAKKMFGPALAKVSKKPAASRLLEDYYAVWLTAFNGISPDANERKSAYEQRQALGDTKQEEAWNRFEIESGF